MQKALKNKKVMQDIKKLSKIQSEILSVESKTLWKSWKMIVLEYLKKVIFFISCNNFNKENVRIKCREKATQEKPQNRKDQKRLLQLSWEKWNLSRLPNHLQRNSRQGSQGELGFRLHSKETQRFQGDRWQEQDERADRKRLIMKFVLISYSFYQKNWNQCLLQIAINSQTQLLFLWTKLSNFWDNLKLCFNINFSKTSKNSY